MRRFLGAASLKVTQQPRCVSHRPRRDAQITNLCTMCSGKQIETGVNPKGAGRKGALLRDVYDDLTPKLPGSAPMVVGGGTLLVPVWLRGLVPLLMATIVRINSKSGSMAMMAKILSLMMTTILKYHPPTNYYNSYNLGRRSVSVFVMIFFFNSFEK